MKAKKTQIFLAGGGGVEDSRSLDEQFVKVLDLTKPLVYIPNAMQSRSYRLCFDWFQSVMTPFGVTIIEMWDDLRPHHPAMVVAGVYIGGGDTGKLLKEIREMKFDNYLREIAWNGIPLYGGSAGAIIFGDNIRTVPEAKYLSLSETSGLGIVKGYSIVCHYQKRSERAIRSLIDITGTPIIAIPEKTGGYITENKLTNYGTEPLIIFRKNETVYLNPNDSIRLQ